jgi:hypothetical protein
MIYGLEMIWKKLVIAYSRFDWNLPGGTEGNHEKPQ